MPKLLVFDLDGTLIDSYAKFERAAQDYAQKHDLPATDMEALRNGYAFPDEYDFGWGVDKPTQRKHLQGIQYMFDNPQLAAFSIYTPAPFAGVADTLAALQAQGHVITSITARPEHTATFILEQNNLSSFFVDKRTGSDVKNKGLEEKPKPDMLLDLMKNMSFTDKDTVMVGDTTMDVEMGKAANAYSIGVAWGYHNISRLQFSGADAILQTSISEIHTIL